jgi:site-specific DNA recombinase
MEIRRRGVETRLVLATNGTASIGAAADPALVKSLVRARAWFSELAQGRVRSLEEIGKAENVSDRYVGALMPLAFLAPDIVARILSGTQPVELTATSLMTRVDLPPAWADQRALLEFE